MTAPVEGGAAVLVTGAAGYIGRQVVDRLQARGQRVVGADIRPGAAGHDVRHLDVRDAEGVRRLVAEAGAGAVVHLAAVLEGSGDRARDHAIDVGGTRNVLAACAAAGVRHLTVTSSGAAYGYHADNPVPLTEADALRGNPSFAYADHKRQVEELLADARREHPALGQLVLRVGTVLGPRADNQITALFDRPVLPAVAGATAPFVFVWDDDLVEVIARGVAGGRTGTYNVAGAGTVSMAEIGRILGKPVVPLPAPVLRTALAAGRAAGIGRYGPEQVGFLRHRPVLDAAALRERFGYTPAKTSLEAFVAFAEATGRCQPGQPLPARRLAPGRVALVTGAGGALGGALVRRLALDQLAVVATDLDAPPVPAGGSSLAADLTDPAAAARLADHIRQRHGHLDLLVHCAGITHRSPAATTDPAVLSRVMRVNWEGPVRLTQAVLPLLRRGGAVVGVSSMAGWMPVPGRAAYGGSKAALWHYLECLRPEVAPAGIDVLVVHPSFLDSAMPDAAGGARPRSDVGRAMPVPEMAGRIVAAVEAGTPRLFPDRLSRAGSLLWAALPGAYQQIAARRFREELPPPPAG